MATPDASAASCQPRTSLGAPPGARTDGLDVGVSTGTRAARPTSTISRTASISVARLLPRWWNTASPPGAGRRRRADELARVANWAADR